MKQTPWKMDKRARKQREQEREAPFTIEEWDALESATVYLPGPEEARLQNL